MPPPPSDPLLGIILAARLRLTRRLCASAIATLHPTRVLAVSRDVPVTIPIPEA